MNRINTLKLHRLILSLKKEEKRFFKLFTKKQNQKEDIFYLKIFDYLDKLETVDRDKFKQKFRDVKGLSGLQTYLYKLILKSLRNQPFYQDVDTVLREGLADLEIFYKKELFVDSQEKLKELLELAKLHDKVFFLPMLYEWWFILENTYFHYHDIDNSLLEENIGKYTSTIENLNQYHIYRTTLARTMWLVQDRNSKSFVDDIKNIVESLPTYEPNEYGFGLSIKIQELQLKRVCGAMLMDNHTSYIYGKELSEILKKQPLKIFEVHEEYYYKALISQIGNAPTLEILDDLLTEVEAAISDENRYFDNHLLMHIFLNKIDLYLLTRAFQKVKECLDENEAIIALIINSSSQYFRDFWYYKLTLYYYAIKNYSEALKTYDTFLGNKETSMLLKRPGLYLKMIIYYEEKEYILLATFLKNFTRFLRKRDALLDPEKQLIVLMNKLVNLPESEHKAILIQTRKNMVDYLGTITSAEKEFLTYFNYIGWIDSQISGAPFERLFFRHIGVVDIE